MQKLRWTWKGWGNPQCLANSINDYHINQAAQTILLHCFLFCMRSNFFRIQDKPGNEIVGHLINISSILLGIAKLLSKVVVPIFLSPTMCIHIALHVYTLYYIIRLKFLEKLVGVKQCLVAVLICVSLIVRSVQSLLYRSFHCQFVVYKNEWLINATLIAINSQS